MTDSDGVFDYEEVEYDPVLNEIWVLNGNNIHRVDGVGAETFAAVNVHGQHIAADGQGNLWISRYSHLILLDGNGDVLFDIKPFETQANERISRLVADRLNQRAWIANEHQLAEVKASGTVNNFLNFPDLILYMDMAGRKEKGEGGTAANMRVPDSRAGEAVARVRCPDGEITWSVPVLRLRFYATGTSTRPRCRAARPLCPVRPPG